MMDEGESPIPGGMARDGVTVYHAAQKAAQFKSYKSVISGIFHLTFQTVVDSGYLKPRRAEAQTRGAASWTCLLGLGTLRPHQ